MQRYICKTCGYIYDPAVGDPEYNIEPGIPFASLPEDWVCPRCGSPKADFELEENDEMPGLVTPATDES